MRIVRCSIKGSGKLLAMKLRHFLTFALIIVISWLSAPTQDLSKAPKPADYPARDTYIGKPAPVISDSKRARLYRTVLREGAEKGPNFAGHYTVVAWGLRIRRILNGSNRRKGREDLFPALYVC